MCPLQGDLLSVTFDPETADATFDGHYVATGKVATYPVSNNSYEHGDEGVNPGHEKRVRRCPL